MSRLRPGLNRVERLCSVDGHNAGQRSRPEGDGRVVREAALLRLFPYHIVRAHTHG